MSSQSRAKSPGAAKAKPAATASTAAAAPAPAPAAGGTSFLLGGAVLSAEGLDHIANHAYKAGKYTPLDNLLNPLWLWLTDRLPMWFAPNLVTFAGFVPMIASYALIWCYSADFTTPVPRWVAFFATFSTLFYQTMDAMDGKQARRTGASSPLGQLFDHGCDCMACLSHHSVAAMAFLTGPGWGSLGPLATLQSCFFLAQWQERYTGVLRTSFGPCGVTEMQYFIILAGLFAGVLGPERLQAVVTTDIPIVGWPVNMLIVQGWSTFCAVMASISFYQTLGHLWKTSRSEAAKALLDMLPVLAMDAMIILLPIDVFRQSPRLVCCLSGLLFFHYTAQIILLSMARMPFPARQPSLLVFAAVVAVSRTPGMQANVPWFLAVATCLAAALVANWLLRVIQELKGKLGIAVFTIAPKPNGTKAS